MMLVATSSLQAARAPTRRSSAPRVASHRTATAAPTSVGPSQRRRQKLSVSAASQSNLREGVGGDNVGTARGSKASGLSASRNEQATSDPNL